MLSVLSIIMNVAEDRCVSVWRHACFVFISEVLEGLVAALDRWPWWALLALAHELRNARLSGRVQLALAPRSCGAASEAATSFALGRSSRLRAFPVSLAWARYVAAVVQASSDHQAPNGSWAPCMHWFNVICVFLALYMYIIIYIYMYV